MSSLLVPLVGIPLLPLLAAVLTAVLGPRVLRGKSHWPTIVALTGSFLLSLVVLAEVRSAAASAVPGEGIEQVVQLWTWAAIPDAYAAGGAADPRDFVLDVSLRADPLTAIMLSTVTFVALLVAIFAAGYMHGDRGYWRFFAYVALFVFSMAMLVSVSNFLLLFVFWEAVGVCSYLLIGYWFERDAASSAGMKAFLVNRVGDFGFAIGIFLIWVTYGTLDFHDTVTSQGELVPGVLGAMRLAGDEPLIGGAMGLAIALALFWGACGKSAQIPLHVWLPDAMEGPTPVSALIHAATMVTAGVYMVTRCAPLFVVAPTAGLVVAIIGVATALVAGIVALTQFDLKRVLAYSTISQLGYMFLGLGAATAAGITAGMFHLFTHAFFKALLFLGAGSVMHAMGNVIDMRQFGGLRRRLPITHATFAVGCLALAGLFPLSGFWSKDAILASLHDRAHADEHASQTIDTEPGVSEETAAVGPASPGARQAVSLAAAPAASSSSIRVAPVAAPRWTTTQPTAWQAPTEDPEACACWFGFLYWIGMGTAFLTAVYTFRAFFMTFYGPERLPPEAAGHAHESPMVMWGPLAVLAVLAAGVGLFFAWTEGFANLLAYTPSLAFEPIRQTHQQESFHLSVAVTSTFIVLVGIGLAAFLYLGGAAEVETLARWMAFRALDAPGVFACIDRIAASPPLQALVAAADRIHVGWLLRAFGLVLAVPLYLVGGILWLIAFLAPYRLSSNRFYFDHLYHAGVVVPLRGLAWLSAQLDRWLIDGLVNLVGRIPIWIGALLRPLQSGLVSFYGLAMLLGILTLIAVHVVRGGW